MNDEEWKELVKEYERAHKEYNDYMDQFITQYLNGELLSEATKVFTKETVKKADELEANLNNAHARLMDIFKTL